MMLNLMAWRLFRGVLERPRDLEMAPARSANRICFLAKAVLSVVAMVNTVAGSAILGLAVADANPSTAVRGRLVALAAGGLGAAALVAVGLLSFRDPFRFLPLSGPSRLADRSGVSQPGWSNAGAHQNAEIHDCGSAAWPGRLQSSTRLSGIGRSASNVYYSSSQS